ncbi:hypothetical protein [Bradyrhizobium sp. CCBAU 53338]|uniref:hypothetical protein n=1 Tax=Bradyrhizobium sp. CCBAU 53338 TaxID=1325111 RepID=UPI001FEF6AD0|nr:hypothetical protein [Bradyrhizobium sp. CCBAU 53338]
MPKNRYIVRSGEHVYWAVTPQDALARGEQMAAEGMEDVWIVHRGVHSTLETLRYALKDVVQPIEPVRPDTTPNPLSLQSNSKRSTTSIDRKKCLLDAIDGMNEQFPVYFDEDLLGKLLSSAVPERVLLGALVEMVDHCLDRYEQGPVRYDDGVDTLAQSAGEWAVLALAEFGLMDRVTARLGRWTPEGKKFLVEGMQEWRDWKAQFKAEAEAEQLEIDGRARADNVRWAQRGLIALCIAAGVLVAGWMAAKF